jgi:hypothetical protein
MTGDTIAGTGQVLDPEHPPPPPGPGGVIVLDETFIGIDATVVLRVALEQQESGALRVRLMEIAAVANRQGESWRLAGTQLTLPPRTVRVLAKSLARLAATWDGV